MLIMTYMTRYYNKYLFIVLLLAIQSITFSCLEDPTVVGEELFPSSDFFNVYDIDSIKVRSYTVSNSEMVTSQATSSFLGTGFDPYFGSTTAEFVTQMRLSALGSYFPYYIDSVVLFMTVEKVTGSVTGPHYLSFYEIDEKIFKDTTYYSTSEISHTGMAVSRILLPKLNSKGSTEIKLDIPNSFGEYLVRQSQYLTHELDAEETFYDYFKGLHFMLESTGEKAFLEFSLDPPKEVLVYSNYFMFYMTDTIDGGPVTMKFILDATNENARFNIFHNDLSTAENVIEHVDDEYPDSLAYVNRWGSITTKVVLSDLQAIKEDPKYDGISITKAHLVFPVKFDDEYYNKVNIPEQLLLRYYLTDGTSSYVPDYLTGSVFYAGKYSESEKGYVFNIPKFVQSYLDDETNTITPVLELTMLQSSQNSVILRLNDNPIASPTFKISYIK